MPYTKTIIGNMALAFVAVGSTVLDVDTERSKEADKIRLFFDHARAVTLEMCPWPFATRQASLQNIGSPFDDWAFRYDYPAGCRRANKIINPGMRQEVVASQKVEFRVVDKVTTIGKAILTDQCNAILEYNQDLTDPASFSASFAQAHALFLATLIGPSLRCDAKIIQAVTSQWQGWQANAIEAARAEQQEPQEQESSFEAGRN